MENYFLDNANKPSQATNSVTASKIGDLARSTKNNSVLDSNGTIKQTERLFSARARYGRTDLLSANSRDIGTDRGQFGYIKLLTSQQQYNEYISGNTSRDLTYKDLLGEGGLVSNMANPSDTGQKRGYDHFLLTGVSCNMTEKTQITEVFGDSEVIYYFGRRPLVFSIRGVLIDSPDNNWFVEWLKMYNDFLRGSQLARNYELIKLVLPNMILTGSISSMSWAQDSNRDIDIPFTFEFIAKIVEPREAVPDGMPTSNKLNYVNFSAASSFMGQAQINSLKGQVASLTSAIQDPTKSLREKGAALNALGTGLGGSFGSFLESTKGGITDFQKRVDSWTAAENTYVNAIKNSAMYQTITSSLNGIRTNLFSPIYGVLSSLTKLVSNAFNAATSLFNNLITPVRNILRDITNISKKAIALVNLVNSSIKGFGRNVTGQLRGTADDFKTAIKTLKKAAGTVATSPASISHSIRTMFTSGGFSTDPPFLRTPAKLTFSSPSLTTTGNKPASKTALLQAMGVYTPETSNVL